MWETRYESRCKPFCSSQDDRFCDRFFRISQKGAEEVITSTERMLRGLVPENAKFWREPRCFAERGAPAGTILKIAEHVKAGLIVLGVRKPTGVPGAATHIAGGVAHKVVSVALCPVLTVRG